MIRQEISLLAVFLSTFTSIHFMSTFFSRRTLSHRISCPAHHLEQTDSDTKPFSGPIGLRHMTTSRTFAYQSCVARCYACALEFIRRIQKKFYKTITKIKQVVNGSDVSDSERFFFKTVSETEIKGLKNAVI